MKRKLIILISFVTILSVIGVMSCRKCGPFPDRYRVIDLDLSMVQFDYDTSQSYVTPIYTLTGNTPVSYDEFGFFITFETESYFSQYQRFHSFGLIHEAYACSPAEPTTEDRIVDIEIYTNKPFDSLHSSDSNLVAYFDAYPSYYYNNGKLDKPFYDLKEFIELNSFVPNQLILRLKVAPEQASDFVFTIVYTQQSDYLKTKTIVTDSVRIIP